MKRFVSLLVAALLLIACIGIVPATADEKVTISFLDISPRDAREAYFTKVFAEYTAQKNPNVTVEYESVPWADAYTKVVMLGAANDLPDMLNMYPSWTNEFIMSEWILKLDDYIANSGIQDTFVAAMGPIFEQNRDEFGGVYSIPDGLTTSCIYVRTDWIKEKLGIDYTELLDEWTWDRYIQLIYELTDAENGRYGISFRGGFGGVDRVMEYVSNNKVDAGNMWENIDDPDNIEYILDTEESAELMKKYVGMYWDGCAPADSINWGFAEMVDGFCGGLTGTLFNDMEVVASLLASDLTTDQWGVLPVPSTVDGKIFQSVAGNSYQYGISGNAENPDLVWDVITWLYEGTNNADYCKEMTLFPVSKSATADEFFGEKGPMAGFLYQMNYPNLWKGENNYGPADVTQVRLYDGTSELQKVLAKSLTVEEWLEWFDGEITELTKDYLEDYPDASFGEIKLFSTPAE